MKNLILVCCIVGIVLALQGCYYDKEELVYPQTTCDTTGITYSKDILPLLNNSCAACHTSPAAAGGGVVLDNYNDVKTYALSGSLTDRITSTNANLLMPKGGPKLPDCSIAKVKAWVNAGAPN